MKLMHRLYNWIVAPTTQLLLEAIGREEDKHLPAGMYEVLNDSDKYMNFIERKLVQRANNMRRQRYKVKQKREFEARVLTGMASEWKVEPPATPTGAVSGPGLGSMLSGNMKAGGLITAAGMANAQRVQYDSLRNMYQIYDSSGQQMGAMPDDVLQDYFNGGQH